MEPTPAKPIEKRRWLIVAFVLALVSMGTWWYWPRGDARFVGKWIITTNLFDKSAVTATNAHQFPTTTLRSSGHGMTVLPPNPLALGSDRGEFRWTIVGNKFVSASSAWPGLANLELLWYRQTGKSIGAAQLHAETIVKISPREFVLDGMDWQGHDEEWRMSFEGEPPTFFTRLPE